MTPKPFFKGYSFAAIFLSALSSFLKRPEMSQSSNTFSALAQTDINILWRSRIQIIYMIAKVWDIIIICSSYGVLILNIIQ